MDSFTIESTKIGVVGAGSWGTALANLLADKGFKVDHWVFEPEVKAQILAQRENQTYLPGFKLSQNLLPTNELGRAVIDKDMVLMVVPSHVTRMTAEKMSGMLDDRTVIVTASKGIENNTLLTMTGVLKDVWAEVDADRYAVLSGPSFAREVAAKVPTALTIAAQKKEVSRFVQHVFATNYFRAYTHQDIVGVELGGAVKNVIAIAAGIIDGLGLGLNTRAALITRGMTEIRRLGLKMGANPRTFTGLAGMGDLVLTCTGDLSRNHTVGKKIGEGMTLTQILDEMQMVAEGVKTAKSVYNLSRKLDVDMPISREIYHVLYDDVPPQEALYRLMTRDLKPELDEL